MPFDSVVGSCFEAHEGARASVCAVAGSHSSGKSNVRAMGFGVDVLALRAFIKGILGWCYRACVRAAAGSESSTKSNVRVMGFGVDVLAFGAGGGVFEMGT